ncbi:MAG: hypothetical protein PHG05_00170 [Candidatus Nanoarchaeia archaeon]|nr:hypothetical protein [Candidatus Nanoarchaeia archaeon]
MEYHKEKFIRDLTKNDSNVCISGLVILRNSGTFIVDDGTGQIQVNSPEENNHEYVRVFGRVIPYEEELQINAIVVQEFSKIDKVLYSKIKELVR